MAAALPQKLRIPSIQPFATRAAQLEKFRPTISYWCDYHIVNQILSKQLHSQDDECKVYTINLMDKLEQSKSQTPPVDAIVDDIAAKAYIEQFALETFQKADNAIHTDQASRQTIDTFQAASTFFELMNNFGPLDAEISSKIKYAKYHALRIAKALKAGEDPNASNPKDEISSPIEAPISGLDTDPSTVPYQPPSIETVPDDASHSTSIPVPPNIPSVISPPVAPAMQLEPDVSPIDTVDAAPRAQVSTGPDYFPHVPTPGLPTVQSNSVPQPLVSPATDLQDPQDFYTQPSPQAPLQPPTQSFTSPPAASVPAAVAPQPFRPQVPQAPIVSQMNHTAYNTDDQSVTAAQKHAKWAMSALNFDDVPTAVKELRLALQQLGAS